jgi:hypothetical protein
MSDIESSKKLGRYSNSYVPKNDQKRLETFRKSCSQYHQNHREENLMRCRKYYLLRKETKRLMSINVI